MANQVVSGAVDLHLGQGAVLSTQTTDAMSAATEAIMLEIAANTEEADAIGMCLKLRKVHFSFVVKMA